MKKNKTIVVGCGRLGSSIATKLSSEGKNVIIIDKSEDSFRRLGDSFNGYTSVGDATDTEVLEQNFINEASSIIITTNSDNVNVFIADMCQYLYNIKHILIRLADPAKEKIIDSSRIKIIFPFKLSFKEFNDIIGGE